MRVELQGPRPHRPASREVIPEQQLPAADPTRRRHKFSPGPRGRGATSPRVLPARSPHAPSALQLKYSRPARGGHGRRDLALSAPGSAPHTTGGREAAPPPAPPPAPRGPRPLPGLQAAPAQPRPLPGPEAGASFLPSPGRGNVLRLHRVPATCAAAPRRALCGRRELRGGLPETRRAPPSPGAEAWRKWTERPPWVARIPGTAQTVPVSWSKFTSF
ncbi:translation initiation factor IF-2-like [Panthera leo]|uniref:translation initiation factor IF-2-like n=1 Tax=Panthera leo TaxID=9689 RepID=UPI001C698D8E|nr:translation initiation factor IF-2-like [Panthera leo]